MTRAFWAPRAFSFSCWFAAFDDWRDSELLALPMLFQRPSSHGFDCELHSLWRDPHILRLLKHSFLKRTEVLLALATARVKGYSVGELTLLMMDADEGLMSLEHTLQSLPTRERPHAAS